MKVGRILIAVMALVIAEIACQNSATVPPLPTESAGGSVLPTAELSPSAPTVEPGATSVLEPTQPPPPVIGAGDLSTIEINLNPVVDGLNRPVGLASAGDGSGRLFVLEKGGVIQIIRNGQLTGAPFLDIQDRVGSLSSERGLLGLAFHPAYTQNGWFFVNYTNLQGDTVISRFSVTAQPDTADPSSETRVLGYDQPAPNHNGGNLVFGPDGYLYIGTGDGGGAGDTYHNGQNTQTYLGKMLRIDVNSLPYSIPPDNPFVGNPAYYPEIWAIGLRNPWRYSFDRQTGELYIADVGQNTYEEVNVVPASDAGGENYGWPIMEGLHCFPDSMNCNPGGLTLPVTEYTHSSGDNCSITGGYVYRGQQYPQLSGIYFYGDYCSGNIWGLSRDASGAWQPRLLLQNQGSLSSFGEDDNGELYVADMASGTIYQLVAH